MTPSVIREWGSADERERFYAVASDGSLATLAHYAVLADGWRHAERADLEATSKAHREAGRMEDIKIEHALRSIPAG